MSVTLVVFDLSDTLVVDGRLPDGMQDVLETLVKRGKTLAVASNLTLQAVEDNLQSLGIRHFFKTVTGADEGALKPSPGMLNLLLLRTATEPQEAIMVGDSPNDIYMARAAGTMSCAVAWQGEPSQDVLASSPDHIVQKPGQLLELPVLREHQ